MAFDVLSGCAFCQSVEGCRFESGQHHMATWRNWLAHRAYILAGRSSSLRVAIALVAQWINASPCEGEESGFESLQGHWLQSTSMELR